MAERRRRSGPGCRRHRRTDPRCRLHLREPLRRVRPADPGRQQGLRRGSHHEGPAGGMDPHSRRQVGGGLGLARDADRSPGPFPAAGGGPLRHGGLGRLFRRAIARQGEERRAPAGAAVRREEQPPGPRLPPRGGEGRRDARLPAGEARPAAGDLHPPGRGGGRDRGVGVGSGDGGGQQDALQHQGARGAPSGGRSGADAHRRRLLRRARGARRGAGARSRRRCGGLQGRSRQDAGRGQALAGLRDLEPARPAGREHGRRGAQVEARDGDERDPEHQGDGREERPGGRPRGQAGPGAEAVGARLYAVSEATGAGGPGPAGISDYTLTGAETAARRISIKEKGIEREARSRPARATSRCASIRRARPAASRRGSRPSWSSPASTSTPPRTRP